MADPHRITLEPGYPEHNAFESQLMLAAQQCVEPGFSYTIDTHIKKFDKRQPYTLLVNDYQYIVDLSVLCLSYGAPSKRKH